MVGRYRYDSSDDDVVERNKHYKKTSDAAAIVLKSIEKKDKKEKEARDAKARLIRKYADALSSYEKGMRDRTNAYHRLKEKQEKELKRTKNSNSSWAADKEEEIQVVEAEVSQLDDEKVQSSIRNELAKLRDKWLESSDTFNFETDSEQRKAAGFGKAANPQLKRSNTWGSSGFAGGYTGSI